MFILKLLIHTFLNRSFIFVLKIFFYSIDELQINFKYTLKITITEITDFNVIHNL